MSQSPYSSGMTLFLRYFYFSCLVMAFGDVTVLLSRNLQSLNKAHPFLVLLCYPHRLTQSRSGKRRKPARFHSDIQDVTYPRAETIDYSQRFFYNLTRT